MSPQSRDERRSRGNQHLCRPCCCPVRPELHHEVSPSELSSRVESWGNRCSAEFGRRRKPAGSGASAWYPNTHCQEKVPASCLSCGKPAHNLRVKARVAELRLVQLQSLPFSPQSWLHIGEFPLKFPTWGHGQQTSNRGDHPLRAGLYAGWEKCIKYQGSRSTDLEIDSL